MAGENTKKLNHLLRNWLAGTVGTLQWLEEQQVYQQLAHEYKKAGWLTAIGRGAFVKAGDRVNWQGAVYALQKQLRLPVHIGGKTALETHGIEHFVPAGKGSYLYLFSDSKPHLPSWFIKWEWDRRIFFRSLPLFPEKLHLGFSKREYGGFELELSGPERAILEVLELVPKYQSFEEARLLMESLVNLRPKMVQELLEQCLSIKAKRLFLYLAEHCNHAWFNKLDCSKFDLGRGKRVVVPGGRFDHKYQITVDREDSNESGKS